MQPQLQCKRLSLIKGSTPASMHPNPPNTLAQPNHPWPKEAKSVSSSSQLSSRQRDRMGQDLVHRLKTTGG